MPETSIERAAQAVGELSASVRILTDEVKAAEALREDKIRWIQRSIVAAGVAVLILVVLAITNFSLLAQTSNAANEAKATNTLLLGCFEPHSQCADENLKQTTRVLDQLRQTQFVIAVCLRQFPAADDPDGKMMVACVQSYYPGFVLPPRQKPFVSPVPRPSLRPAPRPSPAP